MVSIVWNFEIGGNARHIAENGVSVEDVESIICGPIATGSSRNTGRPMATGITADGRLIVVVYEFIDGVTVYVATAFEVDA